MSKIPVYVEVPQYPRILDAVDLMKEKLMDAKRCMHELYDIRIEENNELQNAEAWLSEMETRLQAMNEEVTR
jgi:hypothetical protein